MGKQTIKRSAEVDVFVDSLINDGDGEERFQFSLLSDLPRDDVRSGRKYM